MRQFYNRKGVKPTDPRKLPESHLFQAFHSSGCFPNPKEKREARLFVSRITSTRLTRKLKNSNSTRVQRFKSRIERDGCTESYRAGRGIIRFTVQGGEDQAWSDNRSNPFLSEGDRSFRTNSRQRRRPFSPSPTAHKLPTVESSSKRLSLALRSLSLYQNFPSESKRANRRKFVEK